MAELTKEQLAGLKAKYGTVYTLTVPTNEDETEFATVYLRKIDRACFSSVQKIVQTDSLKAIENLIRTLYVGGDEVTKITENFDALHSAEGACLDMIKAKQGTLKKN